MVVVVHLERAQGLARRLVGRNPPKALEEVRALHDARDASLAPWALPIVVFDLLVEARGIGCPGFTTVVGPVENAIVLGGGFSYLTGQNANGFRLALRRLVQPAGVCFGSTCSADRAVPVTFIALEPLYCDAGGLVLRSDVHQQCLR